MTNGGVDARYRTLTGDFDGDGKSDLATVSSNGGGGWADWIAVELSTGTGFRSEVWGAGTLIHMRNGGPDSNYVTLAGDFDGDRKTDIATVTPNGGGGWADWIALELSTGTGFRSEVWGAGTPIHMRNGGASWYHVLPGDFDGDGKTDLATVSSNGGGGWADWIARGALDRRWLPLRGRRWNADPHAKRRHQLVPRNRGGLQRRRQDRHRYPERLRGRRLGRVGRARVVDGDWVSLGGVERRHDDPHAETAAPTTTTSVPRT